MDIDLSFENVALAFGVTLAAGLATVLGSILVFLSKTPGPRILAFGLAFAGGAMVYVSLSEILNKSILAFSSQYGDQLGFTYATLAFLLGVFIIAIIDHLVPNPHETFDPRGAVYQTKDKEYIRRVGIMTALAITAHNFPEGLATFFAMLDSPGLGLPLAFAIAIHNIPEGISIAIPVYFATGKKLYAFLACLLSGLAEPVGALIGYTLLAPFLSQAIFGGVFGIIAGVMVFLALDELLPAAKRYSQSHETVYGLVGGMTALALSLILFKW
jgi:ZIP family zinc transporter